MSDDSPTRPGLAELAEPPPKVDAWIGEAIQARRRERRWSRQELGLACDLSEVEIEACERGDGRLAASRLHAIAQALGAPLLEFLMDPERRLGRNTSAPRPRRVT